MSGGPEVLKALDSSILEEYEKLAPHADIVHDGVTMRFSTPNSVTLWRVQTIYEKEPWTLEWIAGFDPASILVDCGANVGMYTIWAAATRGARVYAFEPEAQNYATLNRNIVLNNLSDRVNAYCVGLSDTSGLSTLHLTEFKVGASCHALGEAIDFNYKPLAAVYRQGSVAARLDELVANGTIPIPDHIKIDVDGFEPKVLAGARETLAQPDVESLLVEVNQNLDDHRAMVRELNAMGFVHDPAQVARAERKEGDFKGVAEYIFRRRR